MCRTHMPLTTFFQVLRELKIHKLHTAHGFSSPDDCTMCPCTFLIARENYHFSNDIPCTFRVMRLIEILSHLSDHSIILFAPTDLTCFVIDFY